jgi:ATP adenylyltransferase/5',5'''-P-1,P-4-tetraphosphate phosphorylase II
VVNKLIKDTNNMAQLLDIIKDTNRPAYKVLQELVELQKLNWPLVATNFSGLEKVELKQFQFDGFQVKVQFNPERMQSSAAKTDQKSIAARPCFLCAENRPVEQDEIDFGDQFVILVNPFPIFKLHFTISSIAHTEQRFLPNTRTFLHLAEAMEGFIVIYNGPECGASAPDHLHFQAGESSLLPISAEFELLKKSSRILFSGTNTTVYATENYLRKMISIETVSMTEGLNLIEIYYRNFQEMQPDKVEPMMNALCLWQVGKWTIHLFPRKAHRPSQYFASGMEHILISPGSVDFGGLIITPRREDFDKITREDVVDILDQVSLNQDDFQKLTGQIASEMK